LGQDPARRLVGHQVGIRVDDAAHGVSAQAPDGVDERGLLRGGVGLAGEEHPAGPGLDHGHHYHAHGHLFFLEPLVLIVKQGSGVNRLARMSL